VHRGVSLALAAASALAQSTSLVVTGNHWMSASADERKAFLAGATNMIMLEGAYAKKNNLPMPQVGAALIKGADTVRLADVEARITRWYEANPGSLSKPVMAVIWQEFGKR